MVHRDSFSGYHPLVNFIYFGLVLVFTMCFLHPVSLAVSFGCALIYGGQLQGWGRVKSSLRMLLPLMVLAAVLNPAFNHRGATILAYLPSGNPLTLESILYGLGSAVMLGAVILWFACYSAVMTSDKLLYLFGRLAPALSLVLSMTLRFVPKLKEQFETVREAQKGLGRDVSEGPLIQRMRHGVTLLSILVTWSLENAVETADSMKSRGYGLPGRTAFSLYRWERRDRLALCWLLACGGYILYGWISGALRWQYAPVFGGELALRFQLVYLALCLTPVYLHGREEQAWKFSQSKI